MSNIERWVIDACPICERVYEGEATCDDGHYAERTQEIEVVRLTAYRGAVEALEAIRGQAQQPGLSASDAIEAIIGVLDRYDLARGQ